MALAGCDFYCDNSNCRYYGCTIVMFGSWPIGDINAVLNTVTDNEFKEYIIKKKTDENRLYWPLTMPNTNKIPILGYRIQKWCSQCYCLWNFDIILNNDTFENAKIKANIPSLCSKCNAVLLEFKDVIEKSIICPQCKVEMKQRRWFVNE